MGNMQILEPGSRSKPVKGVHNGVIWIDVKSRLQPLDFVNYNCIFQIGQKYNVTNLINPSIR